MCVIMIVDREDRKPTSQMLEKAWDWNCHGLGAAWRVGPKDKKQVAWKKGIMDYDEALALIKKLPIPYVLHFRLSSIGGVTPSLNHPFEISLDTGQELEGKTDNYVLFHNGTWHEWDKESRLTAAMSGHKLPLGKSNDSRAMAWLSAVYGISYLEYIPDQRGIAFGPYGWEVFVGKGWKMINDIWCSNDIFLEKGNLREFWANDMCTEHQCVRKDIDVTGKCPKHTRFVGRLVSGSPEVNPTPTPFRKGSPTIVSLELAQALRERGEISKNLWKDIKEYYSRMASPDQKVRQKALISLEKATSKIYLPGRRV